jgi:hypothetical protein
VSGCSLPGLTPPLSMPALAEFRKIDADPVVIGRLQRVMDEWA